MDTGEKKNYGTFKITGDWENQSKLLQSKFPQLIAADLTFMPGKENDLLTRLSTRLSLPRNEVIGILNTNSSEKLPK